jgi:hypothetical protein
MITEPGDKGTATDRINLKNTSRMIAQMYTKENAQPYLQNTVSLIQKFVKQGQMTNEDAQRILGYGKHQKIDLNKFSDKLNSDGYKFIRGEVGSKDLSRIKQKMDNWLAQNKDLSGMNSNEYKAYRDASIKFGDYTKYLKADQAWRKETSLEVERELSRQGNKYAKHLYNEKGELKSRKEFYTDLLKSKDISISDLKRYQSKIKDATQRKAFNSAIDQMAKVSPGLGGQATSWIMKIATNLDKIGPGNLLANAIDNAMDSDMDYDKLVESAGKVYTSGRIKKAPPGLAQLGSMTGTGLFTPGTNMTWVNPKDRSHSTKGNQWGIEAIKDIDRIDWGSIDKNRITFSGITKTAWDKGSRNEAGIALLNEMKSEMMRSKSKMGNFRIGASPIALNSNGKSAIIIHPDAEWLKSYVYTTNKEGTKSAGLISQEQYNSILKNGISYITDAGNLTNDLYKRSYQSPLQSYVDYYKSYTYKDPSDSRYSFKIEKNDIGTGDYSITTEIPLYDANEGKVKMVTLYDNTTVLGSNLENVRDQIIRTDFDKYKLFNKQLKNGQ